MEFKTATHEKVYEKTRQFLFEIFGEVNVTVIDDTFVLQEGSTFVYVRVSAIGERQTCVEIFSYVVIDIEVNEALMCYLLGYNLKLVLGAFGLSIDDSGKGTIVLTHAILGDTMDKEELYASVSAIARVADNLDDEIVKTFGGKTALDKLNTPIAPVEYWEE
ncbi:MAG: hypothetical protein AB1757_04980 [Acidobacteriota bacterium]